MKVERYTNREIDALNQTIMGKLDEHKSDLIEIKEQVKYTNGKVRMLEKMIWLACGGLGVLTFLWGQGQLAFVQSEKASAEELLQIITEAQEKVVDLQAQVEKAEITEEPTTNP